MLNTITTLLKPHLQKLAAGSIGAVLMVAVWGYTEWRGQDRLDYQYQLEKSEIKELRDEATIDGLNAYIKDLEANLNFLNSMRVDSPLAQWGKDMEGRYMFRNDRFDDWFVISNGLSPDSILLRTDLDIWPDKDLARQYMDVDREIIRSRSTQHQTEYARVAGRVEPVTTWKYVIRNNHIPIGVGGFAALQREVCPCACK